MRPSLCWPKPARCPSAQSWRPLARAGARLAFLALPVRAHLAGNREQGADAGRNGDAFLERSHPAEAVAGRAGRIFPPTTRLPTVQPSKARDRRAAGPECVSYEGMRVSMPFHGFRKGCQGVTIVSHGTRGGAIDLYECGVEVPASASASASAPAGPGPQARAPGPPDLVGDYPARYSPPDPQGFMADLDAPPLQQVFDGASRQRVTDREPHRQRRISGLISTYRKGNDGKSRVVRRKLRQSQRALF